MARPSEVIGIHWAGGRIPNKSPHFKQSINRASEAVYGKRALQIGCGGTIPFMGTLGRQFPRTQFFITGVLGPQSNAHGPNEFLEVEYAKQLTACVSIVLSDHARALRP